MVEPRAHATARRNAVVVVLTGSPHPGPAGPS